MFIKCVVACRNANGQPDFCPVIVECGTTSLGTHYRKAEAYADDKGYELPMVVYDEDDGPSWLFQQFNWSEVQIEQ